MIDESILPPAPPASPAIEVEAAAKTTFAAAQNAAPVLHRVAVRNGTDRPLHGLRLTMTAQPGFCQNKEWTLDRVGPGETVGVGDLRLTLDFAVLDGLNEAEHGQLVFRLFDGETLLDERVAGIELLARDEWGGGAEMPQILAAFVSPNHPAVSAILKEASRLLEVAGHGGALDGYQSRDPRRAYLLAGAVWSAVGAMGLSYAAPPRSFEEQGQKIRDPGCIAGTGLATCLDTALLLAAAFEAAGLHPVVVFTAGHAFVGVWLVDRTFPLTVEPDVVEVRKAVEARELVVLETTLLTQRPAADFARAKANAAAQLAERAEKAFRMAVDVTRARAAGIRPIASRGAEVAAAAESGDRAEPAALPAAPSLDELPAEFVQELTATPADRLDRWQTKLLDLSLRNRLLNFSETAQTLRLVCADVAALEDALADGKKFRIISIRDEDPVGDRDAAAYRRETGQDIERDFAAAVFEKGQVCAAETGREMQSRLTTLYRKARSDLAEGGANTLFMAVGFLRWKKAAGDDRTYKAPLLLLPVRLSRRSAASGFDLSHHEDEVVFNQTLLEFLEREFALSIPALRGELPADDSGLDIRQILGIVRQAVRDVPGFEVVEETALSTFSFAKYLMWKDLVDRTESLKNNRLVRHLLDNPTEPFRDGTGPLPEPGSIDATDPATLFTPLAADSSQLAAVVAAEAGKDFVIVGPPGTGKSQTIANMIAHCLAHGKTVLFVAEKSAALEVVYRRLKAQGLADACLELHSNKADRKSVIAQLGAAWERGARSVEDAWDRAAAALQVQRHELNRYVEELHRPGRHGRSVYHGIGVLTAREARFALVFDDIDAHDRDGFAALGDLSERLALTHRVVAGCDAFGDVRATEWSLGWERALLDAAGRLRAEAVGLGEACRGFSEAMGIAEPADGAAVRPGPLVRMAEAVLALTPADGPLLGMADLETTAGAVDELEGAAKRYEAATRSLAASFADDQVLRMAVRDLEQEWRRESARMWPFSWLGARRVGRMVQGYASGGRSVLATDLPALVVVREALEQAAASGAASLPGSDGVRTDVAAMRASLGRVGEVRAAAAGVAGGDADGVIGRLRGSLDGTQGGSGVGVLGAAERVRAAKARFDAAAAVYLAAAGGGSDGGAIGEEPLDGLVARLEGLERQAARLADWVKWVGVRDAAEAQGLGPMVAALRDRLVGDARADFESAYFGWWLPLAIDRSPTLRGFVHWEHADRIEKFRALIETVERLAADRVRRAVAHGLPGRDDVARKSELGLLRRQLGLQRPSQSIRGLIAGMPETFTKLTPCVLMSPLSVAQYLPAEQASFDMVIFDEASQITTWDAIGAIARGRQSIIVGDPKQLPPTNFFARSDAEQEEELDLHERDLLSILDEASAAGLPQHQLNWHYRSRDEGLIAFSNHHYYGERLVTFPSPATDARAVRFHRVDGVYARGTGRTNLAEARAVVDFVIGRLETWAALPEDERKSIGVITFNSPQQELILDLLDAERRERGQLEWFFSDERTEPVIVKNLENVQGDERDVMVFSITFGRDDAGKLAMDFGAVNRDGGEKRLNVAVTRAKSEFHVFSSITADDIDTRRARGMGVTHLKNYLEYAERGADALPETEVGAEDARGADGAGSGRFEEAVAAALRSKGWDVRTRIGVSGSRIDLGVVHPDRAGVFLAGVACDGATYRRSATARDRDQIRDGVLRNLGWDIVRVWSADWFMRPADALERLDASLRALLDEQRAAESAS